MPTSGAGAPGRSPRPHGGSARARAPDSSEGSQVGCWGRWEGSETHAGGWAGEGSVSDQAELVAHSAGNVLNATEFSL